MILVIVESPSKCKKIEEYLGENYKVIASFGHIREIKTIKNIDIQNNFQTNYEIIEEKKQIIKNIQKEINKSVDIILATDNDNEGEAIAWHICEVFNLPIELTKRITFNEITYSAIQNSIKNPRFINMNIVFSQQTRQILDILIGFTISPILWKNISCKSKIPLSAGRCQTPALKLIYDNFLELTKYKNNNGISYYKTTGYFTKLCLPFELDKDFELYEDIDYFLKGSVNHHHKMIINEPKLKINSSPQPFITSTIQQYINNELHLSPKETMKICQELYEKGFITYMRTNTKKYSNEFIQSVDNYLKNKWNSKISSDENKINNINISLFKDKQQKEEEETNHEAIRPTNIFLNEYCLKEGKIDNDNHSQDFKNLSIKTRKIYNIIWRNSIQSCMDDCKYVDINIKINAFQKNNFKYNTTKIIYEGWKKFDKKKDVLTSKEYDFFISLKEMQQMKQKINDCNNCNDCNDCNDYINIDYIKIISEENKKEIKSHYNEAGLIKKLEEFGIGRPSTYSMLVDKIQERKYVVKENINGYEKECVSLILQKNELQEKKIIKIFGNEKNKLIITPLGNIVIEFLITHYDNLFNYEYTKHMEFFLDEIEKGKKKKEEICFLCNEELLKSIEIAKNSNYKKSSTIQIDDKHSFIIGKNGPVVKKTEDDGKVIFISVCKELDIKKIENGNIDDIIEKTNITSLNIGFYNDEELILKKGKYGIYVVYGNNKKPLSCFGNRPLENISYNEVIDILQKNENITKYNDDTNVDMNERSIKKFIRQISENISIRNGKYGNYIFFKKKTMKIPKFYKLDGFRENVISCDLKNIQNWIYEKYNIN